MTALIDAVKANDFTKVADLLYSQANINAVDRFGQSALFVACAWDNQNIALLLIDARADVNIADDKGCFPLHEALETLKFSSNMKPIAWILSQLTADVNLHDSYGTTPLIGACTLGLDNIAQILISRGANVNAVNQRGYTPLRQACFSKNIALMKSLIVAGADINMITLDKTPLAFCTHHCFSAGALLLIKAGACYSDDITQEEISKLDRESQRAFALNYRECPLRVNFTPRDISLLNQSNFATLKTLFTLRSLDTILNVLPNELLFLLFSA